MKYVPILLLAGLLLTGCSEINQTVQEAQQAVDAGKKVIETGQQVIEQGKQLATTEVAQQLQTYLQQKYDASEPLRKAMFSGDGKIMVDELKKTELANFSFYRSELLGMELKGKLNGDGKFQVLNYDLSQPNAEPKVIHEFQVNLDQSGQIQVQ